jgi:NADH:ubiquinone oxidoreductase subunit 2 (subunit N)
VLISGLIANLTGLPYAAGFIGKEFLLFQLFRAD